MFIVQHRGYSAKQFEAELEAQAAAGLSDQAWNDLFMGDPDDLGFYTSDDGEVQVSRS